MQCNKFTPPQCLLVLRPCFLYHIHNFYFSRGGVVCLWAKGYGWRMIFCGQLAISLNLFAGWFWSLKNHRIKITMKSPFGRTMFASFCPTSPKKKCKYRIHGYTARCGFSHLKNKLVVDPLVILQKSHSQPPFGCINFVNNGDFCYLFPQLGFWPNFFKPQAVSLGSAFSAWPVSVFFSIC